MAQYAVLIYASDSAHAPEATPEDLEVCDDHSDDLAASGVMLAAYALTPRDMATSVRGDIITDGPFVDSKEVVAGFYVIEAPDLDAALAIAGPTRSSATAAGSRSGRCTAATCGRPDRTRPDRTRPHQTTPHQTTPHQTTPRQTTPHREPPVTRPAADPAVESALAAAHRGEWGRVLAATARVTRDLDLAEECVQEAYAARCGPGPWPAFPATRPPGSPPRPGAVRSTSSAAKARSGPGSRCWSSQAESHTETGTGAQLAPDEPWQYEPRQGEAPQDEPPRDGPSPAGGRSCG